MQKKFITIARENKNADFYLVCHTACNELGNCEPHMTKVTCFRPL